MLPLVVVLSLPPGVLGALTLLKLTGLENNIYAHVALIMLIGLLGEERDSGGLAELRRKEGLAPFEAVLEATRQRLRPILMTSLAFVAGLFPLAIATGAGAVGNRTIGTAAVGGMALGTVFGALLVPRALRPGAPWLRNARAPKAEAPPEPTPQPEVTT